ncbi:MAG: protein kinase [Micrococcales bacterium]|nr:protein kinase [Micrococcales bacterium]
MSEPVIPGFEVVRLLGEGGFADVYLCRQRSPRREVAIKVIHPHLVSDEMLEWFDAETDAMAQVSTHPSIVTIYGSGVAEDGRPYLSMEYCPHPSLAHGLRRHLRSVSEVLAIGVSIAGAVETAHRAGILHRDIKPANILLTQYETPALTDFGIASTLADGKKASHGLSVPWSPPEFFNRPEDSGVQSDVWSLGATLYTLLARRAPFEIPGADNSSEAQAARIAKDPLPPVGRLDVPATLERVLVGTMAKDPQARFPSAYAVGTALREIQNELGAAPTPLVVTSNYAFDEPEESDATRLRGPLDSSTREPPEEKARRRRRLAAIVLGILGALGIAGLAIALVTQGPDPEVSPPAPPATIVVTAPGATLTIRTTPSATQTPSPTRTKKTAKKTTTAPAPARPWRSPSPTKTKKSKSPTPSNTPTTTTPTEEPTTTPSSEPVETPATEEPPSTPIGPPTGGEVPTPAASVLGQFSP